VRFRRLDWFLTLALFALGFVIASVYIRTFLRIGGDNEFGQTEFAAAVAQACGKGFTDPGYNATPGLANFLQRQSDTFSCSEFPATLPPQRPNQMQGLYRYLMSAVAIVWRIRGVSWWALWPLFGIAYGATLSVAYGLFRLGMGRVLAVAASLMLASSAIHVSYIPYLRDYAKAPFILGLMLLMARLAIGPIKPRRVLAHSVAFGALLGLGFGFRNDLLICAPPFTAVVLFCVPGHSWAHLRLKMAALTLAALTFIIAAWPIVTAYRGGSNTGHVALLGLMTPFDRPLGINGSLYDWGYTYLDGFAAVTINSYSARAHGRFVRYLSPEYDRAMAEYILHIARVWPADIVTRAYASALKTLEMPFTVGVYTNGPRAAALSETVSHFYLWQQSVLRVFLGRGALIAAAALMIIAGRSVSAAAVLFVFGLYFAGYPAIQFHIRHFFHLEFVSWWAIGFLVQRLGGAAFAMAAGWSAGQPLLNRRVLFIEATRMAVFAGVSGVIVVGSLATLRAYQATHVREILRGYASAPLVPLKTAATARGDQTLFTLPGLWTPREMLDPVATRYIVAEFAPHSCRAVALPVTFRYDTQYDASDFSRTMRLTLLPEAPPTRVLFAAYYYGTSSHFSGIEVPRGFETCLASVSSVADLGRYVVLMGVTLPPAWERATLYQTLADFEPSDSGTGDRHVLHTIPEGALITRAAVEAPLTDVATEYAAAIAYHADTGEWHVSGRPQFADSPLVRLAAHRPGAADVFVAEGELRVGAVNIGLTAGGRWVRNVEIRKRGPFLVTISPPEGGDFGAQVTSLLSDEWPANRVGRRLSRLVWWIPGAMYHEDVVIRRMGWIRQ
jgi:hypothetical protein